MHVYEFEEGTAIGRDPRPKSDYAVSHDWDSIEVLESSPTAIEAAYKAIRNSGRDSGAVFVRLGKPCLEAANLVMQKHMESLYDVSTDTRPDEHGERRLEVSFRRK